MNIADFESVRVRREGLTLEPNPDASHDYVTDIARTCGVDSLGEVKLRVRYVPDRHILAHGALDAYLPVLAATAPVSLEQLTLTFVEDLSDALIPRWIEVITAGKNGHTVIVDDRQPGWNNERLLDRLPPA